MRPSSKPDLLFLHASSVITPHGVVLFMGPSGTGKSTIKRMMADYFEPLADDVTCLWKTPAGEWHCDDGRFHFAPFPNQPPRTDRRLRLGGMARLYQSKKTEWSAFKQHLACEHLLNAFFEVAGQNTPYHSIKTLLAFRKVADLARSYPVYSLSFSLDLDSTLSIRRLLDDWGSNEH